MLGSGRFLYKQVDSIPKVFNARPKVRHCSGKTEKKIIIPRRIERGPTDILKALASTISLDPTAFNYKYPDDPFFYAYSQIDKRVYALSLESGRKAAKWVMKENPKFFKHQLAEPPVKAFLQKADSTTEGEATEESLLNAIEERNVLGAIKIYEDLKANNQDVGRSTKQSLLELVCFYNGEERPDLELESKWFQGFLGRAGSQINDEKNWDVNGFPERLFQEMDPNCPLAISAIIQGRLKYKYIDSALELYNSAKKRNIKLSVGVYNSILSETLSIVNHQHDRVVDFVKGKLNEMSKQNVTPNLGTLNAALKPFSDTYHVAIAKSLVSEFLKLGIQPSLGSYGYLLQIFSKLKHTKVPISKVQVEEIMNEIENREHKIRHPSDLDFFWTAMSAFSERFDDCDLALRLHEMYLRQRNSKFMVRAMSEYVYYKHLFFSVFKHKPIDFAMDFYRRYVFTCFSPDSRVVTAIIAAIHENLMPQYLVELWKDFDKLGFSKNRPMLSRILALMKDFKDEESLKVFHEAAINFLEKLEDIKSGDEEFFPDILLALARNKDQEKILEVMKNMREKNIDINMPESIAGEIMDLAISVKSVPLILETLRLAVHQNLTSTSELAKKCLPLLSGGDEAWASTLITQKDERKTKPEEKDV